MRIDSNSVRIDCIHTTPCSMHIQRNRFESGLNPLPKVSFDPVWSGSCNATKRAIARYTCDRNTNVLFNVHFNQQLIGARLLPCLVTWMRPMRIGCKLNVNWMRINQFGLQIGSNLVQVQIPYLQESLRIEREREGVANSWLWRST